jgi:hypothetical protein
LSDPAVELCLLANITQGDLTIGKKTVPINKTITIQGGAIEKGEGPLTFVAAENGDTLSKTVLSVPGGLLGIGGSKSTTEATVTTELAGPASGIDVNFTNLFNEHGLALRLAMRAKLSNPLLGGNCYVGSEANPIVLNLTVGTTSPPAPNKPITGRLGELKGEEESTIFALDHNTFVDNAFAVPAVTGCGGLYSPLASKALGVPSPAGRNTAVLTGKLELAVAQAVKESE